MARIAGVNIPSNKRVEIALTYVYGIGRTTSKNICAHLGIAPERRVNELSDDEVLRLREHVEGELAQTIDRLQSATLSERSTSTRPTRSRATCAARSA